MQVFSEERQHKVEGLLDVAFNRRNGQVALGRPTVFHVRKFNDLQTLCQHLLAQASNPRIIRVKSCHIPEDECKQIYFVLQLPRYKLDVISNSIDPSNLKMHFNAKSKTATIFLKIGITKHGNHQSTHSGL